MKINLSKIANELDQAASRASAVPQVSLTSQISINEAYAIQHISIGKRLKRGEKQVGIKMGFTSEAKMKQMGVNDMIWGILTSKMHIGNNEHIDMNAFIHPRAEPEIAFKLNKAIDRHIPLSEIKDYVSGVAVAVEIIDSRYENFKFSLEDVIADNCSSSAFVVGEWNEVSTPIQDIEIALKVDNEVIESGNTNAILGNPWKSLSEATRLAFEYGERLEEGTIVLAGAATSAKYIEKNQKVSAIAKGLGEVCLHVI